MLVCLSFFGSLLLWLSNCEASHHISLSLPLFAPELIKHGNVVSCEFMVCCAACVHTGLCRIALSLPPCNRHADEITATLLRMTVIWGIFIKTATESVCVCVYFDVSAMLIDAETHFLSGFYHISFISSAEWPKKRSDFQCLSYQRPILNSYLKNLDALR